MGQMNTFVTVVMYGLWVVAIIFLLAATFTRFQYVDLNIFSLILLSFALVNSFFGVKKI